MTSQQRFLSLGLLGLLLGVGAALFMRPSAGEGEPAAPKPVRSAEERVEQFSNLLDAQEIPEEKKGAENYNQERWGHLADEVLMLPHVDGSGESYFQDTKVYVGMDGRGNPKYLRAIMRARKAPENIQRLNRKDVMENMVTVKIPDFKPSQAAKLAAKLKPFTPEGGSPWGPDGNITPPSGKQGAKGQKGGAAGGSDTVGPPR